MKKEYWRKAQQCAKCVHHCPEGPRPHLMDPTTIWKEACSHSGYSFRPQLEEAEICFNFKNKDIASRRKDKTEMAEWARKHPCRKCAFYDMNGFELRDKKLIKTEEDWYEQYRCPGYAHVKEHDKDGFCSSFLTLDQWAELQSTPIYDGERMQKWDAFRDDNTSK